jgi:hypothetical protein
MRKMLDLLLLIPVLIAIACLVAVVYAPRAHIIHKCFGEKKGWTLKMCILLLFPGLFVPFFNIYVLAIMIYCGWLILNQKCDPFGEGHLREAVGASKYMPPAVR